MSVLPESLKKRAEELISSPLWEGPHDSFGVEPIIIFDKGKAVNAEPASTILLKDLPGYRLFPLVDSCWRQRHAQRNACFSGFATKFIGSFCSPLCTAPAFFYPDNWASSLAALHIQLRLSPSNQQHCTGWLNEGGRHAARVSPLR